MVKACRIHAGLCPARPGVPPTRCEYPHSPRCAETRRWRRPRNGRPGRSPDSRARDIPVIRLDRDLVLQQGARARGAIEASLDPVLPRPQPAINLSGTDLHQLGFQRRGDSCMTPQPRQPRGECRGEALRTQIAGRFPDLREEPNHVLGIGGPPPSHLADRGPRRNRPPEQPNGVLAMIPTYPHHFVQQGRALSSPSPPIPFPHHAQILVLRPLRHATCLHPPPPFVPHHVDLEGKICK